MEHRGSSWKILRKLILSCGTYWNIITQSVWGDWLPQIGDTCGWRWSLELISSTRGSHSDWIVPDINYLDRSLRDCCPGHRGVLTKSILEHTKRSVRDPLQLPWDAHLGALRDTRQKSMAHQNVPGHFGTFTGHFQGVDRPLWAKISSNHRGDRLSYYLTLIELNRL